MRTKFKKYNEKYEVGSDGSVYSLDYNHTGKRKVMSQYLDRDGYPYVFFVQSTKRTKNIVHRLIAELFLKKPTPKHQVNHKNGVRNDNRLKNLEWVTSQENALHGWRSNGRKLSAKMLANAHRRFSGVNNPKAKMTVEDISLIRTHRRLGQPLKWISSTFGISISQVSAICTNRNWNPNLLK